jgi:hypothetical protein
MLRMYIHNGKSRGSLRHERIIKAVVVVVRGVGREGGG